MPNWSPDWNNVKWDHGAAVSAARALDEAANQLEEATWRRRQLAEVACEDWRGRYRNEFDADLEGIVHRANQMVSEFRAKANEIRGADQRARDEQNHREEERRRWKREKEEEDRLNLLKGSV